MDGNIVDIVTMTLALGIAIARLIRRKAINSEARFEPTNFILDFLNGTLVVPFLLLFSSVFSSRLLVMLLDSNKGILAIVGMAGFVVLVRDFLNEPAAPVPAKRAKPASRR